MPMRLVACIPCCYPSAMAQGVESVLRRLGDAACASRVLARSSVAALLALLSCSCDDLSSFTTTAGEVYSGEALEGSLVLVGFEPRTRMDLTFDVDLVDEGPGTITIVPPGDDDARIFDAAPLLPVTALRYDSLGGLDFPSGRLRNYLFLCPAGGAFDGRDAVVIVSLMSGGDVEVRLILGTGDLYGIFLLEKTRT